MSTMIQMKVKPTEVHRDDGDDHSEEPCLSSSESDYENERLEESENESDLCEEASKHKHKKCSAVDEVLLSEIMAVVTEGGDITKLKLDHCKAYLRKYGLRLMGKKAVLLDRIQEHMEIKNGGEAKYRREDFSIKCTGDVCQGDLILFEQKVYEKFDIASRSARGTFLGKRIVAGRVVKESYGAAKQQHTFTIEVLWSSGTKQLPPLHPLLVKGRNLYRLETYRQPWMNEAERKVALDEKHTRGGVARAMRAASKAGSLRPALKPLTNRNGNVSSNFSQILNGKAAEQTQGVRGNFNHILNGKAAEQTQGVSSNFNHILNGKVAEQTQGVLEIGPHHLCGKAAGTVFQSSMVQNLPGFPQGSRSDLLKTTSLPGLLPVPANYKFATKITCTSCHNPGARNCISRLCYYCCRRTAKFCERHSDMQLASIHVSLR